MKKIYLIFIVPVLLMTACSNHGKKYFTGTITYDYTYTSEHLDVDSLKAVRPFTGFFRYDTTGYQSRFIGKDTNTYFYSGDFNKCLAETGSQKNYTCENYNMATDSVMTFRIYDAEKKILGHECFVIEMQKKRSTVKYYYSKKLRMAPMTYDHHHAYNWDFYGAKSDGGLVLKLEHRFGDFVMVGIATEIKKGDENFKALEIDDKLFTEICQ